MSENQPDTTSSNAEDPTTAAKTPAERLKELQDILKNDEEDLAKLTKERDALKTDVDSLAKSVGEIDKAKTGLAKALPQLAEEREKLNKYKADMLAAAEVLLGPSKAAVDAKIIEIEKRISDAKTNVTNARERVRTTTEAARLAQEDLDKKQKSYDEQKNLEKDLGDKLKNINDFKTRIDKLNDVPKAASMYVLLREMNAILTVAHVPTKEEFEAELDARWTALEKAKESARTKILDAQSAKAELASAETALAALEKSRIDDLIAGTDEFNK
jgi:chromosome segregation ATPase